MKSRKRRLLREDYINPEGSPEETPGFVLSKTSIDAQVTAWFQRFEEESASLSERTLNRIWTQHALDEGFGVLFEQEEPPEDPAEDLAGLDAAFGADEEVGEEMGVDDIVSDIESGEEVLDVVSMSPSLDVETFASRVQSLVESAQNKLEFKNPIINMAVTYLRDQYDEDVSQQFIEQLEEMGYKVKIEAPAVEQGPEGGEEE